MQGEQKPETEMVEERKDMWYITDEVLRSSFVILAEQFVHDEEYQPESREAFVERATYIMRQVCPVAYSYFFDQAGLKVLPHGSTEILLSMIRRKRPLFLGGGVDVPHS